MARVYLDQPIAPQPKKRIYLDQPAQKKRVYLDNKPAPQKQESVGAWRRLGNQLIKPLASSANLLEDTGKSIGYQIARRIAPEKDRGWEAAKKQLGIDFGGHQADVWAGKNKRVFSDIAADAAGQQMAKGNNVLGNMMLATGVAGDFILDPLNKVKIAALTQKGVQAAKTGNVALSAAEQAQKGQRALLQFGNTNILPSVGNRVLAASTKANDVIRGTRAGGAVADMLSKVSTSIRPSGVSRADFKTLADARTAARLTQNYTKDQAIQFAKGLEQTLRDRKASDFTRSQILHAIEKGDKSLVPQGLDDVFEAGVKFKGENEAAWKALGGSTLDNYGLAHVATDEVANEARKKSLSGGKLFSTQTPQDIHREWVKVDGKVVKLSDDGIKYKEGVGAVDDITSEARKYKSAEEFVNSFNLMKSGEVTSIGQLPISKVNKTQIRAITERGLPHTDTGLKVKDFTPGRKVTQPLEVYSKGGSYVVENGNHRLAQALANGDTHIPVVFKRGEGKTYSTHTKSQLIDLWNKAQGGNGGYFNKAGKPVNVEQATAKEINESLAGAGKSPIFKEDLPTVVARMGISTGKKKAGVEFLEATKGLEGKAKELANEAYEAMTNVESLRKAIKYFDNIQNIWKAQVLVAPSYHIRNEVGNLWNNFLANVAPDSYVKAGALQKKISSGSLTKAETKMVEEMKKLGVIGTGQYGGDITQAIADEVGGASINPLSQRFGVYKGNRAIGSAIEDNAKIAHYLSKIREGFAPKQAAESVRKYLFDYSDLTWTEQNLFKRVMPFYTWTRKNVPLQIQAFFENPGKFSNAFTLQRNVESQVEQPNERYLSEYIKNNTPIRISTNEDGTTSYLLLGQWLPAASALQMLTQDPRELLNMLSPVYKVPKDMLNNQSFFKDSLGRNQPIERYPGEMKSFLGMDMGAKTANVLRNIRVLSELDKLNPGLIFGGKDTPSKIPGGSQNRGARQSPDAPEATRWRDFLTGKTQTYNPENSKYYYDRDTKDRMDEYTQALNQALRFKNIDQARQIIEEMKAFQAEREAGKNTTIDQYNLMGDQYLEDRYNQSQAEFARDKAREQMKELVKQGVRTNNPELLRQAAQLDPSYIKDAIKNATEELGKEKLPDEAKRMLYEFERDKTEYRLRSFYTK